MAKKKGKTEVYPFWYIEDIKNMMEWFEKKGMWHWWITFNLGLLLGRRVSDTLSFKWGDFYYENGRMKDEIEIVEEKTEKYARMHICGACRDAIRRYAKEIEVNPLDHLDDFMVSTQAKSELLKKESEYDEETFHDLMWEQTQSQAAAYRKQFKIAAKEIGITYEVSTHSTRKSFGFWSVKLHPYDVTVIDKLQSIFNHSDRNTTMKYIGLSKEGENRLYRDMGNFVADIKNGVTPVVKNSPVISVKSEDFRNLLSMCWDMAQNGCDKFEGINNIIDKAEQLMVQEVMI